MGKRKTNGALQTDEQQNTISAETTQTNQLEMTQSNSTAIKYSGKVSVKLQQGNRILSNRRSNNSGGESMFKFIAYSLAGEYSIAEELRPCKIMLFHSAAERPSIAVPEDGNKSLCNFKYVETKSIPANTSTETAQWSTTYHFRIPYAWIKSSESVNTVCLYGKNAISPTGETLGDFSAWYQFTKKGQDEWDPIETNNLNNTNIIIDWTVSIENK